jgi:hypothetical protein
MQGLKGSRDLAGELDMDAQQDSGRGEAEGAAPQQAGQQGAESRRSSLYNLTSWAGSAARVHGRPPPQPQAAAPEAQQRPAALQPPLQDAGAEGAARLPSPSASFAISSPKGSDAAEAIARSAFFGRACGGSSRGSSSEGASPQGPGPGPLSSSEVSRRLLAGARRFVACAGSVGHLGCALLSGFYS